MAIIGMFKSINDKMQGKIRTLTLEARVELVPIKDAQDEKAPQYRVFSGPSEIGAAWNKVSERTGKPYIAVKLDDPSFAAPIFASLIEQESGDGYALIWSRRS
jgi:uncharacterized protein (DUF736 family)